ncbi:hypothetical protein HJW21_00300 [[Clostridium] symbiosum]|nr:hypothetical protein [[Clostridium] symbiosum]
MERAYKGSLGGIEEFENEDWEEECFLFESEEDHQVWLDKSRLMLPKLGLEIHSGIWYEKDEGSGQYEADFDFYMFFDAESKVYLYMEQGSSLITCIHNYTGISWEELENQPCEMVFKETEIQVENQMLIYM